MASEYTFYPKFSEFVTLYRGVVRVWIADGTTLRPGTPGVLYAEYVDGLITELGYVSDYDTAKQYFADLGIDLTYQQWVEILVNTPENAKRSEAWAVGKINGDPVPSTDETKDNNSRYYADQSKIWAKGQNLDGATVQPNDNAAFWANEAHGWTNNKDGSVNGYSETNNAKYWAEQSKSYSDGKGLNEQNIRATDNAEYYKNQAKLWANNGTDGDTPSASNNAKEYARQASQSATAAGTSEASATAQAATATTKATEASNSASAAAASATSAADSEANASTFATNASNSADAAAFSASAASTSEINAAASDQHATTKASEADSSAQAAAVSESNAAQSESNAATSEANASASETAAAQSEANASTAETNASASASAASVSESNAHVSEQAAAQSAIDAAQSETNASTSATNAAQSEQDAAQHASDALDSKNAAEAARDRAETAIVHEPRINNNDNWEVWSSEDGEYEDTGHKSIAYATAEYAYQNSTNGRVPPTGTWTESPEPEQGKFLWVRMKYTWTNGRIDYFYNVTYIGVNGTGSVNSVNGLGGDVVLDGLNVYIDNDASPKETIYEGFTRIGTAITNSEIDGLFNVD